MDEAKIRQEIVETGKQLLEKQLVARTWGNVSERIDRDNFLITPSGLDYTLTTPEDIVRYHIPDGSWEGRRKPSSEKGVHAAAYLQFPDVNFVIHTHQTYATALGLAGWENIDLTEKEAAVLEGIGRADYGLPGTKKLWRNVTKVLEKGNHIVLMAHHGALIAGKNKEDALRKAELLEDVCRKNCKAEPAAKSGADSTLIQDAGAERIREQVLKADPLIMHWGSQAVFRRAAENKPLRAQLDDMAQMIGWQIPTAGKDPEEILKKLRKSGAVMVPGVGAFTLGQDADDSEALGLLTQKAAVSSLHTKACGGSALLPLPDVLLMRYIYLHKYSKQKGGNADG